MRIKVLPQTLINQIAAGEVVVRMASAVKELVENSIDAGATRIEVSLSNEGRDVTVRDDGSGMGREDAELALQRHATSKIRTIEDLAALRTRGFRGEAVPSIASVSRLEIQTRETDALSGTRIVVEGGRILRIESVGCPPGTRIIVRDLFYNTPARLKFLKSVTSEMNAVLSLVTRQALAVPQIGFVVDRDGRELLNLPAAQSLSDRFVSVLGAQVMHAPLPVDHLREGAIRVQGLLAHPQDARSDRRHQYFFVNGRPFSNRSLGAALEQACRGFAMIGKFPVCCLFIDVPPEDVDVNVHPTKEEVRFRDERAVAGAVYRAAEGALQGSPALVGEMQLGEDKTALPIRRQPDDRETPPTIGVGRRAQPDDVPRPQKPPAQIPGFFTSPEELIRRAFERKAGRPEQPDWLALAQRAARPAEPAEEPTRATPSRLGRAAHGDGSVIAAGPGERPDDDFWAQGFDPEPLGQIGETYIMVRYGGDLLIVDQHASHERLRYLELRRANRRVQIQPLLVPITVEVSPAQGELLRDLAPQLLELGFELGEFGPRSWAVQAIPADLPEIDPVPLLLELADDLEEARRIHALADLRDRILIRAACHSAIRAGQQLSLPTMRELLEQIRNERLSLTCPHGRPTIVRLSRKELDRQFKRIV